MASFLMSKLHNFVFILLIFLILKFFALATSYQFQVGGDKGWTKPSANETNTYNECATKSRFRVGDSLYFKYYKDSVVEVNSTSYNNCITSNPISTFDEGNTIFQFDRFGLFYFISGQPGHCKGGQKMVVGVMANNPPEEEITPNSAPTPQENGDDGNGSDGGDDWDSFNWGPPSLNSTIKLTIASSFMTVFAGVLVVLYLLI